MSRDMVIYVSAGGQSTRLYPLTLELTKAWLDVANKTPFRLALEGVTKRMQEVDVFILTQGLINDIFIPAEIRDGSPIGNNVHVNYVHFYDPTKSPERRNISDGSGEGFINFLENYKDLIGGRLILTMNVDNLAVFDPVDMARYHRNMHGNNPGVTIGVTSWEGEGIEQFGTVGFDNEGKVTEFKEKSNNPASNYINTAIVMFSPDVLDFLRGKSRKLKDMGGDVIPYLLDQGVSVYAYGQPSDRYGQIKNWIDFGTIKNYLKANGDALLGVYPWFSLDRYKEIQDGVFVHSNSLPSVRGAMEKGLLEFDGRVLIGSNVAFYGNQKITLENSVIGHNVKIGYGAEIRGIEENGDLYPSVILDASGVFGASLVSAVVGYSSYVYSNRKRAVLEPYSVVGNDVNVYGLKLPSDARIAKKEHTGAILRSGKYDIRPYDKNLIIFTEI